MIRIRHVIALLTICLVGVFAVLAAQPASACDACDRMLAAAPSGSVAEYLCPDVCPHVGHYVVNGHQIHGKYFCGACDCCVRHIEPPLGKSTGYEPAIETTRQRQMAIRRVMGEDWWAVHGHKVR